MKIANIITSLTDYPNHVCTTIFTIDCNLRCSFCFNPSLFIENNPSNISTESALAELDIRRGYTSFVCVTGGEPTLQPGLYRFLRQLFNKGFKIKLDTNGTNPHVLQRCSELLSYVAMDLKTDPKKYSQFLPKFSSLDPRILASSISRSIKLINNLTIPCEFRTTVLENLTLCDYEEMAKAVRNCKRYVIKPLVSHTYSKKALSLVSEFERLLAINGCKEIVNLF